MCWWARPWTDLLVDASLWERERPLTGVCRLPTRRAGDAQAGRDSVRWGRRQRGGQQCQCRARFSRQQLRTHVYSQRFWWKRRKRGRERARKSRRKTAKDGRTLSSTTSKTLWSATTTSRPSGHAVTQPVTGVADVDVTPRDSSLVSSHAPLPRGCPVVLSPTVTSWKHRGHRSHIAWKMSSMARVA